MRWVRIVAVGALLGAAALAHVQSAESDDQASNTATVDVELDSAIQALRGRLVGQSGEAVLVQTTTRDVLVHLPPGFSAPIGACIQVAGQVPLGPVFEAEQASLVPAEDRAAACP